MSHGSISAARPPPAVAELQGVYGPFVFPEKLLQKIWLRGDFDATRLTDAAGRAIKVLHPGKWNLLGGPDFKGARLSIDGTPPVIGDVELHLRASDWAAHGHARDPAYDAVVLHVVLFPPAAGHVTQGVRGELPVAALLPLLHHDLEEYAAEEAVEALAHRPASQILEELAPLEAAELATLLRQHAQERWRQKVHFAGLRIRRLGWEEACHHAALEILGYRFNRAPMLRVAGAHPLREWTAGSIDADAVFLSEQGGWSLQGIRPASHPRTRLRQYAAWTGTADGWPERLAAIAATLPFAAPDGSAGKRRREHRFPEWRERLVEEVCGGSVSGTRLDNLVCDGFLPLLAAQTGRDFAGLWHHWFPGDLPPLISQTLRRLGVFAGPASPACHGAAQGLLGWLIARERREAPPLGRGA